MKINISSTNSTPNPYIIPDLSNFTIEPPFENYPLYPEFPIEEINSSEDLQNDIKNGIIIATNGNGEQISDSKNRNQSVDIINMQMNRFDDYDKDQPFWYYKHGNGKKFKYDNSIPGLLFQGKSNAYVQFGHTKRIENNIYSFQFRFGDENGNYAHDTYFRFFWAIDQDTGPGQVFEIYHTDDNTNEIHLGEDDTNFDINYVADLGTQNFVAGQIYNCTIETFGKFVKIYIDNKMLVEIGNTNEFTNANPLTYSYGSWYIENAFTNSSTTKFYIMNYLKVKQMIGG